MFQQFGDSYSAAFDLSNVIAGLEQFGARLALDQIGTRRLYRRDAKIYAEGDAADCWFRVISGTVRLIKLLADGRRHIAEFCFAGDCFGLNEQETRVFAAEAVGNAIVMRFSRPATRRLLDTSPELARQFCAVMVHDLTHAQTRMLLLARMTATERVATFLLELSDRRGGSRVIELPMSRGDIADYLGLTLETVCRVLSGFKRDGIIAMPVPQRIELIDRDALTALCDA